MVLPLFERLTVLSVSITANQLVQVTIYLIVASLTQHGLLVTRLLSTLPRLGLVELRPLISVLAVLLVEFVLKASVPSHVVCLEFSAL